MIYHITTYPEWIKAERLGEYSSTSLMTDDFIHCSRQDQIIATANLFFRNQNELILLCIDETRLTSICKYEMPSPDSTEVNPEKSFPHVYGKINLSAVTKILEFSVNQNEDYFLSEL
jgi:uncharacterized protein (DUF952 family)